MNKQDKTLSDYIARKNVDVCHKSCTPGKICQNCPNRKKLTFEEWYIINELQTYDKTEYDCMKMAWKAAQENV